MNEQEFYESCMARAASTPKGDNFQIFKTECGIYKTDKRKIDYKEIIDEFKENQIRDIAKAAMLGVGTDKDVLLYVDEYGEDVIHRWKTWEGALETLGREPEESDGFYFAYEEKPFRVNLIDKWMFGGFTFEIVSQLWLERE